MALEKVPRADSTEKQKPIVLKLYVAGHAPNSVRALTNLNAFLTEHSMQPELRIVDVLENPGITLSDNIMVTPTLVIVSPVRRVRVIGDLSDRNALSAALKPIVNLQ